MKLLPIITGALGVVLLIILWYCRGLEKRITELEESYEDIKIEMQENQTELTNATRYYYEGLRAYNENLEVEMKKDMKELKDTCIDMNVKTREDILKLMQKGENKYE